ncbi:hypothetical protein K438DRAFT_1757847 [Mycena galopus ATCC 62051]|nr:hypothetical protein K438DRAFT_1757847 [Mycena galopus ATCC 62051]
MGVRNNKELHGSSRARLVARWTSEWLRSLGAMRRGTRARKDTDVAIEKARSADSVVGVRVWRLGARRFERGRAAWTSQLRAHAGSTKRPHTRTNKRGRSEQGDCVAQHQAVAGIHSARGIAACTRGDGAKGRVALARRRHALRECVRMMERARSDRVQRRVTSSRRAKSRLHTASGRRSRASGTLRSAATRLHVVVSSVRGGRDEDAQVHPRGERSGRARCTNVADEGALKAAPSSAASAGRDECRRCGGETDERGGGCASEPRRETTRGEALGVVQRRGLDGAVLALRGSSLPRRDRARVLDEGNRKRRAKKQCPPLICITRQLVKHETPSALSRVARQLAGRKAPQRLVARQIAADRAWSSPARTKVAMSLVWHEAPQHDDRQEVDQAARSGNGRARRVAQRRTTMRTEDGALAPTSSLVLVTGKRGSENSGSTSAWRRSRMGKADDGGVLQRMRGGSAQRDNPLCALARRCRALRASVRGRRRGRARGCPQDVSEQWRAVSLLARWVVGVGKPAPRAHRQRGGALRRHSRASETLRSGGGEATRCSSALPRSSTSPDPSPRRERSARAQALSLSLRLSPTTHEGWYTRSAMTRTSHLRAHTGSAEYPHRGGTRGGRRASAEHPHPFPAEPREDTAATRARVPSLSSYLRSRAPLLLRLPGAEFPNPAKEERCVYRRRVKRSRRGRRGECTRGICWTQRGHINHGLTRTMVVVQTLVGGVSSACRMASGTRSSAPLAARGVHRYIPAVRQRETELSSLVEERDGSGDVAARPRHPRGPARTRQRGAVSPLHMRTSNVPEELRQAAS